MGCISNGQEAEYRELADCFVAWCGNNHLILNVKTKKMIVYFRRTRNMTKKKWRWWRSINTSASTDCTRDTIPMLSTRRIHCTSYESLGHSVSATKYNLLLYMSVVESTISSARICWGSRIRASDIERKQKGTNWIELKEGKKHQALSSIKCCWLIDHQQVLPPQQKQRFRKFEHTPDFSRPALSISY